MMLSFPPDRGAHPALSSSNIFHLDGRRGVCFVKVMSFLLVRSCGARAIERLQSHFCAAKASWQVQSFSSGSDALAAPTSPKSRHVIVMRRNSCAVKCVKVSGISSNLHLTQRALDWWVRAAFSSSLHGSSQFR